MGEVLHRERANGCEARLWALIDAWAAELPFPVVILSGCRTNAEQAALYAQGRTAPGPIVTKAWSSSTSAHGHGAAIDAMPCDERGRVVWDTPEVRHRVGMMAEVAERLGVEWGGRWLSFPDYDHFQLPDWAKLPVVG